MRKMETPAATHLVIPPNSRPHSESGVNTSRRNFLSGTISASAIFASGVSGLSVSPNVNALQAPIGPQAQIDRQTAAQSIRVNAANLYLTELMSAQERNDDELLYNDRRAVFGKTLRHNNSTFETLKGSYDSLLSALDSGEAADFANILRAGSAERALANPQAAYAYDLTGGDAHASRISPAPVFAGAEQAAEMAEVYWHAYTRDVAFTDFANSELIEQACDDLNGFTETVGPKEAGLVTPNTIFRGGQSGPYVSQFLLQDIPYGPAKLTQRYAAPLAEKDFMQTTNHWLRIQRGRLPNESLQFDAIPRYIYNQRALGEYVHQDVVAQAYINAALIMLSYGPNALSPNNPYIGNPNEGAFVTFGVVNILDLLNRAATLSLKTAWYQKWLVHRRLRPEVFGMRVARQYNNTKNYAIHSELMNSFAVAKAVAVNPENLALLPQAYPEGSPTHPSYPAGHATIAGACSLVLKAFFNPDYIIQNPVVANTDGSALLTHTGGPLTLGEEIDKLAANMTLARDAAGVHYRSDGIQGIIAGEQVALGLLRDVSLTYNEAFSGFSTKTFGGNALSVVKGEVFSA